MSFIEQDDGRPFFALIAPPACHSPFTAAPQHAGAFDGQQAPRWPSFNKRPADKHWLLRQGATALPDRVIDRVDHVFRQRWRTLLSVDDMVGTRGLSLSLVFGLIVFSCILIGCRNVWRGYFELNALPFAAHRALKKEKV